MKLTDWKRLWTVFLLLLLAVYAGGTAWVARAMDQASRPNDGAGPVAVASAEEVVFSDAAPWARPGLEKIAAKVERFQLAGTYQSYTYVDEASDPEENALALVDDLETGTQHMVRDGDALGPFTVAGIDRDAIRLRHGQRTWTLQLSGRLPSESAASRGAGGEGDRNRRFDNLPALETTRFGKRVAEDQWVLDRERVKRYARDIAANPLRAANLYRSFSQVADEEDQDQAGFRVNMKGEKDFFSDMGITNDDVIRRVNSMQMKNQARAEYLVGEFMKDRMGMVVLDVERDGETRKLIYVIRE